MAETRLSNILSARFSTRSNLIANFAGNAVAAITLIVAIPLYLPFVGIEVYGLIGLFAALQGVLPVLDLGLGITLTRELSIRARGSEGAESSRDLVRTTEAIYWAAAAAIVVVFAAGSPFFAGAVNAASLGGPAFRDSLLLMGVALALNFPINLYSGGLYGLQRQVLLSSVNVVFAIVKNFGVLVVFRYAEPSAGTFFGWQAVAAGLHVATLGVCLWAVLPAAHGRARFRLGLLRNLWRFTGGVAAISIVSVLITQIDKFVLIRVLPLEIFGYYALAAVAAGSLQRVVQPIFQVWLPRLSEAAAASDPEGVAGIYHQGCQLIAVAVLPFSAVLIFFSRDVMLLWQRNAETADSTFMIVSLLTAGTTLNSFLFIPYGLQLAYGWTRLQLISLSLAVVLSIPMTVALATKFGTPGAAAVWVVFNLAFILLIIPIMHRRLLPDEKWNWYRNDLIKPIAAAAITAAAFKYLLPETVSAGLLAAKLAVTLLAVFAAVLVSAGRIREAAGALLLRRA